MKKSSVAILVFAETGTNRDALTEEKYKNLAAAFRENRFDIHSVMYNDTVAGNLNTDLLKHDAVLVWVNPIEQGNNRNKLDELLRELSARGIYVSCHPEVILKIGTKEILYKTRELEFGTDCRLYTSFESFKEQFLKNEGDIRILKQHRGNGGNGVYKIDARHIEKDKIIVTHAAKGSSEKTLTVKEFLNEFKPFFQQSGMLIDQEWNPNIINGMVRCYLTGKKVSGFGYQEINALYPKKQNESKAKLPGKRFYFSEDCGMFGDLKEVMENKWVPHLQKICQIEDEMLPVIWDADFFINKINTDQTNEKYSLCEINVSCVSPFPESCIPYIIEEVRKKLN